MRKEEPIIIGNKKMKKLTAVLLVLVLVLSLCACGGGSIEGKYTLKEIKSAEMDTEAFEAILAIAGMKLSDMTLEIKSDGTALLSLFGETESVKWEEKGGKYYIDDVEVKFSGNKITLDQDGETMIFEK